MNQFRIAVLGVALALPAAARIHYDLKVELRPAGSWIGVSGSVLLPVPAEHTREITLLLNRGLKLTGLSCAECAGFDFETTRPGTYMYAPAGAPVTVRFRRPLAKGRNVRLRFHYEGKPQGSPYGVTSTGPEWIELALYNAWYPMQPDFGRFTFDVSVAVDPQWKVTGAGRLSRTAPGRYRLRQTLETFDIDVEASKRLQTFEQGGLRIDSVGLPPEAAQRVARTSAAILKQFSEWFGPMGTGGLTVVFAERQTGGGYARPGFVCFESRYISTLDETGTNASLAHEIAHLWWTGAPAGTWEDWLNESFAEYAANMYVRQAQGGPAFEKRLGELRKGAAGTPPIRGIDRKSPQAYAALYQKGPLLLNRLEAAMGPAQFLEFLAIVQRERIHATERLLARLESFHSRAMREELERLLVE